MSAPAWKFEHSAECAAPRQFVWTYWTDVKNWDDPPARFELDGPFRLGARITTHLPGQRLESLIRQVHDGREALVEMELPEAVLGFRWRFEEVSETRSKLTQTITLSGDGAAAWVAQTNVLGENAPAGLKKLIAAIERSFAQRR